MLFCSILRTTYATDLSDTEWQLVESYVRNSGLGRPTLHSKCEMLNTIFYQLRISGAYSLPPHNLPSLRTVYK